MIIPADAGVSVQAALREIERRLRDLETAASDSSAVRQELNGAVSGLRRDISQVATKPTYLEPNDIYRSGPAHMHGYVPDPGYTMDGAELYLGADGWTRGVVETVPHGSAGTSLAQRVVNVHGSLAVQSALSADAILTRQITEINKSTHPRHGFELEPDGSAKQTVSYDKTTQKITVTPTAGSFHFWIDGKRFEKTRADLSPAHSTTTGMKFFYYDSAGALQTATTPWSIRDRTVTPVAAVYWNNSLSDGVCFYECHTADRQLEVHYNLHFSRGCQYISGYDLTGYTLATQSDAGVTYAIGAGVVADEDIRFASLAVPDGGPYVIFYRTGAAGEWTWSTTSTFPFAYGTTYPSYNQWTGATWQLTEGAGSGVEKWINYFVCATTAVTPQAAQAFLIPGQSEHASLTAAQAESLSSLSLGTLPFEEVAPLYRVTLGFKNSYAGARKTVITQVTSLKNQTVTVAGGSVGITDHGNLTGLADDDHAQYHNDTRGDARYVQLAGSTMTGDLIVTDKQIRLNDGGTDSADYGTMQVTRAASGHVGSHIAMIRAGTSVCGLGFQQSTNLVGFGSGTTGAFSPSWLYFDPSTGNATFGATAYFGNDGYLYITKGASAVTHGMDNGDYLTFDRTNNDWNWVTGGSYSMMLANSAVHDTYAPIGLLVAKPIYCQKRSNSAGGAVTGYDLGYAITYTTDVETNSEFFALSTRGGLANSTIQIKKQGYYTVTAQSTYTIPASSQGYAFMLRLNSSGNRIQYLGMWTFYNVKTSNGDYTFNLSGTFQFNDNDEIMINVYNPTYGDSNWSVITIVRAN